MKNDNTLKIVQAFELELNLTEQGLLKLTEQKKGLVIDVKSEAGFKLARKERTEQNKTVKNIDDLGIAGKHSVDAARVILKDRVIKIYAPIVTAFEEEDKIRKEKAKKKEVAEASRIKLIKDEINNLRQFALNLTGKDSAYLQDIIESVDLIDVSINFAELTQEAIIVKKETLSDLNVALTTAIQNEQLAIEREKLRTERLEQEETNRINELKTKAQERLNTLMMIPSGLFGKSSFDIGVKINSIENYEIQESEFGELFNQANQTKQQVIQQLTSMGENQELVESAKKEKQEKEDNLLKEQMALGELIAKDIDKSNEPMAEGNPDNIAVHEEAIKINTRNEGEVKEIFKESPVRQRLAERFNEEPVTDGLQNLTQKQKMNLKLRFWKKQYGGRDNEFNDLMGIINQYI